jgi:hypothetical protein
LPLFIDDGCWLSLDLLRGSSPQPERYPDRSG